MEDTLPKRAVSVRKAAEKGELIRDTLRDSLTKSLRSSLEEFPITTGTPSFITRRGAKAGRISPALITEFEKKITQNFKGYTKRDKTFGMPSNIHTIAVTEARGTINEIKHEYVERFSDTNPNLTVKKKWIQNRSLSKKYRKGHSVVNGRTVLFNEFFKVPVYKSKRGVEVKTGEVWMRYPHDPNAPANQVIGCNCDYDVFIAKKRKTTGDITGD